jgi:hypothetical protein
MINLEKLHEKRQEILKKILQIESDLKKPLKMDLDDNAQEEGNREILNGIYKVEKDNLDKIDKEIESIRM